MPDLRSKILDLIEKTKVLENEIAAARAASRRAELNKEWTEALFRLTSVRTKLRVLAALETQSPELEEKQEE